MNSGTTVSVKRAENAKQDFAKRWGNLPAGAQERFYRMKCAELLAPQRYHDSTPFERNGLVYMRDNMKKMPNGKEHPKVEPLMSC